MAAHDWIEGINGDMSVSVAAEKTLQTTLATVMHHLAQINHDKTEAAENIHQLRIATRRVSTAIKLYRDVLPRRHAKWIRRRLSKVRRTAGMLRDFDVLAKNGAIAGKSNGRKLRQRIRQERRQVQPNLDKLHRQMMRGNKLDRHVARLLGKIDAADTAEIRLDQWARLRLQTIGRKFFAASDALQRPAILSRDVQALHRLRIRGKELRYALELLAPALPAEPAEAIYHVVRKLQSELGDIHDSIVAGRRFEGWLVSSEQAKQRRYLLDRLTCQWQQLDNALWAFDQWWTAEFAAETWETFANLCELAPPDNRPERRSAFVNIDLAGSEGVL